MFFHFRFFEGEFVLSFEATFFDTKHIESVEIDIVLKISKF
jgi:hypothetical protein